MITIEETWNTYRISTNKAELDRKQIQKWLNEESYWATNRLIDTINTSIENSLCIGVYEGNNQVGFARVVTDYATFGWLCDVFILQPYRNKGLGKWLIDSIIKHPVMSNMRLFLLATRDAHGLYERYGGFKVLDNTENWMVRKNEK